MQIASNQYTTYDNGWIVRVQPPTSQTSHKLLLLIHGWTGDENSMWIFARQIPDDYLLIAPRGPVKASPDGYGWVDSSQSYPNPIEEFFPVVDKLLAQVTRWSEVHKIKTDQKIDLMGFSQGSAMCYSIALRYPDRIGRLAALAGYLPKGTENYLTPGLLSGIPFFIAHGSQDDIVSIDYAHRANEAVSNAGADVTYCEDPVAHKLGGGCFKSLVNFFNDSEQSKTGQQKSQQPPGQ